MALINVTPIMTSNTTPSPYVVSTSSSYTSATDSENYDGWYAFNGEVSGAIKDCWATKNGTITGWIMLDFGYKTKVDVLSIKPRLSITSNGLTSMPKDFELYGSDDGRAFTLISSMSNINDWAYGEFSTFLLPSNTKYRMYKIKILSNNGHSSFSSIGQIRFLQEFEQLTPISHKNASLTYTLPMATTEKIKAKSNDNRVGLLGMANDDENFGDLYVVGKDGKSHLTKSGIKSEILFEGNASVLNEKYVLSKPITDFKMLVFFSNASSSTSSGFNTTSVVVNVDDIKYINNEFYVNLYQGGYERNFNFTIHNDNISFSITRQILGGLSSIQITKVIGIY